MKSLNHPLFCAVALAVMLGAGISHWCSVQQLVAVMESGVPVSTPKSPSSESAPAPIVQTVQASKSQVPPMAPQNPAPPSAPEAGQKQFYEALITKMQNLQNQNRDLLDQLAETNRDLMKLEFRVDTHSESFRPLPTSEDRPLTSFETNTGLGVLPPRAEPVDFIESQ